MSNFPLQQWRDYFWTDISAQMRRLHRPVYLFEDCLQLSKHGQFGEWLWEVLTTAHEKLSDEERMRALVTVEVGENDVCKLSWVVKGENAEKEEREWVLVKVPDGEA